MNYEIVQINVENAGGMNREVAYLLERASGRLLKVLVEDRTVIQGYQGREVPAVPYPLPPTASYPAPANSSFFKSPAYPTATPVVPIAFREPEAPIQTALPDKPVATPPPGFDMNALGRPGAHITDLGG